MFAHDRSFSRNVSFKGLSFSFLWTVNFEPDFLNSDKNVFKLARTSLRSSVGRCLASQPLRVDQRHYSLLTFPKNSCKKFCLIGFLSLTVTCTAIFFGGKHDLFVPIVGIVPQNQSVTKNGIEITADCHFGDMKCKNDIYLNK